MVPHISIQAFVHSPTAKVALESAMRDRHLTRAVSEITIGGIAAAAAHFRLQSTPDLLIVEAENDVLAELRVLAEVCDLRTRVLVIGHTNDVALYKCVMQQGVTDYLVAPVEAEDVIASLLEMYGDSRQVSSGKTYAFISSRGGAGSSVISQSVAWIMAGLESQPLMFADLNVGLGSALLSLNVQGQHNLPEAPMDPDLMDAALLDRLLIRRGQHMRILASSIPLSTDEVSAAATSKLVELARAGFRRTVLDLPTMWTSAVREALLVADDVVVIAVPDLISLRNTQALLDFLAQVRPNDSLPKLVINQIGQHKRPEIKPSQFVRALKFKPAAMIKSDPATFGKSANSGMTISESSPRSAAARTLTKLCDVLLETDASAQRTRRRRLWRLKF